MVYFVDNKHVFFLFFIVLFVGFLEVDWDYYYLFFWVKISNNNETLVKNDMIYTPK